RRGASRRCGCRAALPHGDTLRTFSLFGSPDVSKKLSVRVVGNFAQGSLEARHAHPCRGCGRIDRCAGEIFCVRVVTVQLRDKACNFLSTTKRGKSYLRKVV